MLVISIIRALITLVTAYAMLAVLEDGADGFGLLASWFAIMTIAYLLAQVVEEWVIEKFNQPPKQG